MSEGASHTLHPIGYVRSELKSRKNAPRQGDQGAPDAWLEIDPRYAEGLHLLEVGDRLDVLTFLHDTDRSVLQVRPGRGTEPRESAPLTGVFATRSPDRPNPIGIHPVTLREIDGTRLRVGPIEAIDGTPVMDIKPERC